MSLVSRLCLSFGFVFMASHVRLHAQDTLPQFATIASDPALVQLQIPGDLGKAKPSLPPFRYLIITLDPEWQPNWEEAAFQLKSTIVEWKTGGVDVLVGLEASLIQLDGLMEHELAPYFDGYIFREVPIIPTQDTTGKLWQITQATTSEALTALVEAASIGTQVVIFENLTLTPTHRQFLEAIQRTETGSLDIQPDIRGLPQGQAQFFFQPETGNYHLGLCFNENGNHLITFNLADGLKIRSVFPEGAEINHLQLGNRTELRLGPTDLFYFLELVPAAPESNTETLKIVEQGTIDPYELVVKNQVFKDRESQKFVSLKADEFTTYRYQTPDGSSFEVTWEDTLFIRKDLPIERMRNNLYLGGARWRGDTLPKLPLLEPDKVQTQPLIIDFNKTYSYTYLGEENLNGAPTWKVGFKPMVTGNYSSGTVWIDKETGAHRKIRAIQSNLEPPVVANEIQAFYDWVVDGDVKYWTQVRESGIQVLNIVGARFPLQIDSFRKNYQFNRATLEEELAEAYRSDKQILRDTPQGFRYLAKKGGQRVLQESQFLKQRALLGGVIVDPGLDTPIPLAGFNYINLDFLGKGYQANFFVAGVINDILISQPDFLGKGWDLTAELFATALHFEESVYQGNTELEEESVEKLRESFNLTLGIPLTNFLKLSGNYSLGYLDFKKAEKTSDEFVLPSSHFENIFRVSANYDRKRFSSELEIEQINRSEWEAWGFADNSEPLEDSFRRLTYDMSLTKSLGLFQTVRGSIGYFRGWDMDRFARAGLLNGAVSGFDDESVQATEALRAEVAYDRGISDLFQFTFRINGARTWLDLTDRHGVTTANDPIDLYGMDLSANFFGPWKTVMRLNIGYGIASDIKDLAGDFSAQILFLRLF